MDGVEAVLTRGSIVIVEEPQTRGQKVAEISVAVETQEVSEEVSAPPQTSNSQKEKAKSQKHNTMNWLQAHR